MSKVQELTKEDYLFLQDGKLILKSTKDSKISKGNEAFFSDTEISGGPLLKTVITSGEYFITNSSGNCVKGNKAASSTVYYKKEKIDVEDTYAYELYASAADDRELLVLSDTVKKEIGTISIVQTINLSTARLTFEGMSNLTTITGLDNLTCDTGIPVDAYCLFKGCTKLTAVEGLKLAITNAQQMFYGCWSLTKVDLKDSVFSNCSSMREMFYNCKKLETVLFNSAQPFSNVTSMESMFADTKVNDKTIEITFPSGEYKKLQSVAQMFRNCNNVKLTIGSDDVNTITAENLTNVSSMFEDSNVSTFDFSKITMGAIESCEKMFYNCKALTGVTFNTNQTLSSITSVNCMFAGCTALTQISLSSSNKAELTLSSLKDCAQVFRGCAALKQVSILRTMSAVTNLYQAFYNCTKLYAVKCGDYNGSEPNYIIMGEDCVNFNLTFCGCNKLASVVFADMTFNNVTNLNETFRDCSALKKISLPATTNSSQRVSMTACFEGCKVLTEVGISADFSSKITDVSRLFKGCSKLTSVAGVLNTSMAKDFSQMFHSANITGIQNIIKTLDLHSAENLSKMFSNTGLTTLQITQQNTPNFYLRKAATCDNMFYECTKLTSIDLTYFWHRSGPSSCDYMFQGCEKLVSANIKNLTNSVLSVSMEKMFYDCKLLESLLIYIVHPGAVNLNTKNFINGCSGLKFLQFEGVNSYSTIETLSQNTVHSDTGFPESLMVLFNFAIAPKWTDGCIDTNIKYILVSSLEAYKEWQGKGLTIYEANQGMDSDTGWLYFNNSIYFVGKNELSETMVNRSEVTSTNINYPWNAYPYTMVIFMGSQTKIPKDCFYQGLSSDGKFKSKLQAVVFSSGSRIQKIGSGAFYGTPITEFICPSEVNEIGDDVFNSCSNLVTVELTSKISKFTDNMFYNCTSLTKVDGKNITITSIGKTAFYNCTNLSLLQGVTFSNITEITDNAFYGCTKLWEDISSKEQVNSLLSGVTSIGKHAFDTCGIYELEIPKSCTTIGENAFANSKVAIVKMSDVSRTVGLSISDYAFYNCIELQEVTFADKLINIGKYAFAVPVSDEDLLMSNQITEITIPNSVTSIGENAFFNNQQLQSVVLGSGITYIPASLFRSCVNLLTVTINATNINTINEYAFSGCGNLEKIDLSKLTRLQSIEKSAFQGSGLRIVKFCENTSSSLKTIKEYAFADCRLCSEHVAPEGDSQKDPKDRIDGGTFDKDCKATITAELKEQLNIEDTIIKLVNSATDNTTKSPKEYGYVTLADVCFTADSTFKSGKEIFDCGIIKEDDGLYSDGEAWKKIYNKDDETMSDLILPNSVGILGEGVFSNNPSIPAVNFTENMKNIKILPKYAFSGNSSIESVTFPKNMNDVGDYAFKDNIKLETVTYGNFNNVEINEALAFEGTPYIDHQNILRLQQEEEEKRKKEEQIEVIEEEYVEAVEEGKVIVDPVEQVSGPYIDENICALVAKIAAYEVGVNIWTFYRNVSNDYTYNSAIDDAVTKIAEDENLNPAALKSFMAALLTTSVIINNIIKKSLKANKGVTYKGSWDKNSKTWTKPPYKKDGQPIDVYTLLTPQIAKTYLNKNGVCYSNFGKYKDVPFYTFSKWNTGGDSSKKNRGMYLLVALICLSGQFPIPFNMTFQAAWSILKKYFVTKKTSRCIIGIHQTADQFKNHNGYHIYFGSDYSPIAISNKTVFGDTILDVSNYIKIGDSNPYVLNVFAPIAAKYLKRIDNMVTQMGVDYYQWVCDYCNTHKIKTRSDYLSSLLMLGLEGDGNLSSHI